MERNINYLPTELIYPNVYQPRKYFDEEAIDDLANSIKAFGIIQPISVRKISEINYELVAGERRLRAAKKAGLKEIPALIIDITDRDSAVIALLENIQREDLNFIEEAEAFYNLIEEHSYTQEKLAEEIGKSQSTIANKLRILKLNSEVRSIILENKLTERHARALLKLHDDNLQKVILKIIIEKNLNVKKTEELIEKELLRISSEESKSRSSRIKTSINPKIYVNTIKQVFSKYGVDAKYNTKESDKNFEVTIIIPKNR
jgi:ParB family transcriptional regulator, chromosome partitioning protein